MHDIWNPWHGCKKISEGCEHCYMYYLDGSRGKNGADIHKNISGFRYPLKKNRSGEYVVRSGEQLRVCMTSDFFLEEADPWRDEAWDIIRQRRDIVFFLLTKRPERVLAHLPKDFGEGWEHVFFNVTCENQRRADERVPLLLELPFKHKGVMCAPFIGPVDLSPWLETGQIKQVICGGENYDSARPCHYEWVSALYQQCKARDIRFCFIETGSVFVKDGRRYHMPDKRLQAKMAYRSGLRHEGRKIDFHLETPLSLLPTEPYAPWFGEYCEECGSRMICNGCAKCRECSNAVFSQKRG